MLFILILAVLAIIALSIIIFADGVEKAGAVIPLGLALIVFVAGAVYRQSPGESLIIQSFGGEIIRVDESPGVGFTAPWNKTISFNIRNQKIEMFTNGGGNGEHGSAINAPLKGSSNASVSITVTYSMKSSCIEDIFNTYRNQERLEQDVLFPGIRDIVRQETSKFEPLTVKEKRGELATSIQDALTKRFESKCVMVTHVDLGDISLDENTENAIKERNTRQIAVESAAADLEKATIEAETKKVAAQAEADADQIIRCGARSEQVTKVVDGKEIVATQVTPLTGAECENRLNEQVLASKYFETLEKVGASGNMVIITDGKGTQPIVNIPTNG